MAHCSGLRRYILLVLWHSSLTSQNQYFEKPGTAIIEAFPTHNIITSDERGDQDLAEDSSETCSKSKKFVGNPATSVEQLSPEFMTPNRHTPNSDPYLRATLLEGQYFPYSAYNAYNNLYQGDSLNESGPRRGSSYNDIWYPYTNPSVYASVPYSNIPPVSSLPPVYARIYGKSWPIEQEWFPSQIRRYKRLHNDDDILKQLEYDSIMKNILPTMSIPLPHVSSITQSARVPYSHATFPYGTESDCVLPILLGCTPKVTYGNMVNQDLVPIPYAHAYRNLEESNKVHDHIDITDSKVVDKH